MSNETSFLGINPLEVYQAAVRVANQETPAGRLANRFREELLTAESVVRQHQVVNAVSEYRETWVAHADRAAKLVRRLGDDTASATATVVAADDDSSAALGPSHDLVAGQQSLLLRPIDGRSVIT